MRTRHTSAWLWFRACVLGFMVLYMPAPCSATNWLMLDATEPGTSPPWRVVGLIQPTYQLDLSDPIEGATGETGAWNGRRPFFGVIPPGYRSSSSFYIFRARFGARGRIVNESAEIDYELVGEFGANGLTTLPGGYSNVELAEGSVTISYIPGVRIRVGEFKIPGPEESLRSAIDYVNFSNVTAQLVNYQPARPIGPGTPGTGVPVQETTGVIAYRDQGVQFFDAFQRGSFEYSYAMMVGNGSTLNTTDDNSAKTLYAWLEAAYIFDSDTRYTKKDRNDATVFIWRQSGKKPFNGSEYRLIREGVGVSLQQFPFHATVEYIQGAGMLYVAPAVSGEPARVFPDEFYRSRGFYVDLGVFLNSRWKIEARYDELQPAYTAARDGADLKRLTLGVAHLILPTARVAVNYEIRRYDISNATPADGDVFIGAEAAERAIGDRVAVQMTLSF